MLAVLAAVLLLDPSPRLKADPVSPKPVAARSAATSTGPTLRNVAVTLECTARASGRVENCRVLEETHPGLGFGEAAVALMRDAEAPAGPRDVQFARTIQFLP